MGGGGGGGGRTKREEAGGEVKAGGRGGTDKLADVKTIVGTTLYRRV